MLSPTVIKQLSPFRHDGSRGPAESSSTGWARFRSRPATSRYYDQRAPEYDDWYEGRGLFADRQRPAWADEVERLVTLVGSLPPARTLDVACGTGS